MMIEFAPFAFGMKFVVSAVDIVFPDPPQAEPVLEITPAVFVKQPVVNPERVAVPVIVTAPKVWRAVHVCARFSSATVPVFAGKEAVTVPKAPATVPRLTKPEEEFPKERVPAVPLAPIVTLLDPAALMFTGSVAVNVDAVVTPSSM